MRVIDCLHTQSTISAEDPSDGSLNISTKNLLMSKTNWKSGSEAELALQAAVEDYYTSSAPNELPILGSVGNAQVHGWRVHLGLLERLVYKNAAAQRRLPAFKVLRAAVRALKSLNKTPSPGQGSGKSRGSVRTGRAVVKSLKVIRKTPEETAAVLVSLTEGLSDTRRELEDVLRIVEAAGTAFWKQAVSGWMVPTALVAVGALASLGAMIRTESGALEDICTSLATPKVKKKNRRRRRRRGGVAEEHGTR